MDSTSPIATRTAGQTSAVSGSSCKPTFAMGTRTLVGNLFVGRRWSLDAETGLLEGAELDAETGFGSEPVEGDHRRYREYHHRSADGDGRAS